MPTLDDVLPRWLSRWLPRWYVGVPVTSVLLLAVFWGRDPGSLALVVLSAALVAAVLAAVHHAEVVAHRVGEPFGTLVLAVAVTVIEVADREPDAVRKRRHRRARARHRVRGVHGGVQRRCRALSRGRGVEARCGGVQLRRHRGALATLAALATLSLVLPGCTTTSSGQTYSEAQLAVAGVASLVLYGVFVFVQTVRHRDYFLPVEEDADPDPDAHASAPSSTRAAVSMGLLLLWLIGVVGMAKTASSSLQDAVTAVGAPPSLVGVVIAIVVLLP